MPSRCTTLSASMLVALSLQSMAWRAGTRTSADIVALEFAVERGAADAEHASGEGFVAFYLLEDTLDGGAFDVFEIGGVERNRDSAICGTRFGRGREIGNHFGRGIQVSPGCSQIHGGDGRRQIAEVDQVSVAQSDGALHAVLEFANVAGPVVIHKSFHGGVGNAQVSSGSV